MKAVDTNIVSWANNHFAGLCADIWNRALWPQYREAAWYEPQNASPSYLLLRGTFRGTEFTVLWFADGKVSVRCTKPAVTVPHTHEFLYWTNARTRRDVRKAIGDCIAALDWAVSTLPESAETEEA